MAGVGSGAASQKHGWAGLAAADAPRAARCGEPEAPLAAGDKQEALRAGGAEAGFTLRPQPAPRVSLTDLLHPAAERPSAAGQQGTGTAVRAAAASQAAAGEPREHVRGQRSMAAAGESRGHIRRQPSMAAAGASRERVRRQQSMVQFATDSHPSGTDEPGQGPSSNLEGSDLNKRGQTISFILDSSGADALTQLGDLEDPNEGKLYCVHPRARQRKGGILKQASGIPLMKGGKGSRTTFPDLGQPGAESSSHQTQQLSSPAQVAADASQAPTSAASPEGGCETAAADKTIRADMVNKLQLLPCTPLVAAAEPQPFGVTDTPLPAAGRLPAPVAATVPVTGLTQPAPSPAEPDAAADLMELEAGAGMQRASSASSSMGDRMDAMWREWRHTM